MSTLKNTMPTTMTDQKVIGFPRLGVARLEALTSAETFDTNCSQSHRIGEGASSMPESNSHNVEVGTTFAEFSHRLRLLGGEAVNPLTRC
jgi:hypothetical protein